MKNNLLKLISSYIIFIIFLSFANLSFAQGEITTGADIDGGSSVFNFQKCDVTPVLLKDGKTVKASSKSGTTTTVNTPTEGKYILRVITKNCSGSTIHVAGSQFSGKKITSSFTLINNANITTNNASYSKDLGSAATATYVYTILINDKSAANMQVNFGTASSISTTSNGSNTTGTSTGTSSGNTSTGSVSGGVQGQAGASIDGGLGVKSTAGMYDSSVGTFFNAFEFDNISEGIARVVQIMLVVAGMLAVLFIVYGGFMMVLNSGNSSAVAKARLTVIYAVAGLLLSLFSFSIVAIIQRLING